MCAGRSADDIAAEVGNGGAAVLKRVITEAVNEHLRPLRVGRRELADADDYLRQVLAAGNAYANTVADRTLQQVREAMGMTN